MRAKDYRLCFLWLPLLSLVSLAGLLITTAALSRSKNLGIITDAGSVLAPLVVLGVSARIAHQRVRGWKVSAVAVGAFVSFWVVAFLVSAVIFAILSALVTPS